jgi:predicted nucleic acid-binding protein
VVVVDASALAAVAFRDEQADAVFDALGEHDLHAPSHFVLEMTNATLMRCRRAPARAPALAEALARSLSVRVMVYAVPPIEVLALALRTGLTAYDAGYLWLASDLGSPLATLDRQLAAAAVREGVTVLPTRMARDNG